MGITELRKQELQAQRYHQIRFFDFLITKEADIIIRQQIQMKLTYFNHFDTPDHIITTLGPGVYIFFQDRKVKYIGSSKEMRARVKRHTRKNAIRERKYKPGDRIITIGTMTEKESRKLEDRLIILIKSPRNTKKTLQGKGRY